MEKRIQDPGRRARGQSGRVLPMRRSDKGMEVLEGKVEGASKGCLFLLLKFGCLVYMCTSTEQVPSGRSVSIPQVFHPPCCDSHNELK